MIVSSALRSNKCVEIKTGKDYLKKANGFNVP